MQKEVEATVCDLLANTGLTLQQIADNCGLSYKQVWACAKRNFSREFRLARKVENYRQSKLGDKNPMSGKFGKAHHNYIGVVSDNKGYLMILKPEWYTGRKGSKHIFLHSKVMCEALGLTEIPKGFVVHHIDHNPHNNDIHNLVMLSINAHTRLHQRERATTISKESRLQEKPKRAASVCPVCEQPELDESGFCRECVPFG